MGCPSKTPERLRSDETFEWWTENKVHIRDKDGKVIKVLNNPAAEAIKRWGFQNDTITFKNIFQEATGKPFEEGIKFTVTDYAKVIEGIKDFGAKLKKSSTLVPDQLLVGRSIARKNPVLGTFYKTLNRAGSFRSNEGTNMTAKYNDMIKSLRDALIEYEGLVPKHMFDLVGKYNARKKRIDVFEKLTEHENRYVESMRMEKSGAKLPPGRSVAKDMRALQDFLDKEGQMFQDFIPVHLRHHDIQ